MIVKGIEALKEYLETPRKIVIIGHKNPDGDAVGSTLGLQHYLNKKGHSATVVMPNMFPDFINWLPGTSGILKFDSQNTQSLKVLEESDITFLLDFNALHRVGDDMQQCLENYTKDFVLIDHHQQPDEFSYMYSDTSMSSTCQMVYNFIEMLSGLSVIDQDIATCLYTGIMTDTGSFRFRSTTSTTHRIIANLIDSGAQNDRIHSNTFDANSFSRLQLLGSALSNLTLVSEYKTAYITISQEEKDKFEYKKGDTDGIVNYALSVKGIVFAVIFIEDKEQGIVKISFRSKGSFSVNKFARNYFDGGGHDNAAGGRSLLSLSQTVSRFLEILPNYQKELALSYEI